VSGSSTFPDFVARIRAGDEQAAAELVRQFEPLIRREIRVHLEDDRLGRLFDSMDICQSVLASFFLRTAAGEYDLERPEQLVALLVTMARNKLASAARREHRACRDNRRLSETPGRTPGRSWPARSCWNGSGRPSATRNGRSSPHAARAWPGPRWPPDSAAPPSRAACS
jgi:DNA-directed RNA polymerase specialized sigma24 family protein